MDKGLSNSRREAIRYYYEYIFGCPKEGTLDEEGNDLWTKLASTIQDILLMPKGSFREIKVVFRDVYDALKKREVYDSTVHGRGRHSIIEPESDDSLVVFNAKRSGLSIYEATIVLNQFRIQNDLSPVSYHAVQAFIARSPVINLHKRGTKKAGSNDEKSDWAIARVVECTQFEEQLENGEKYDAEFKKTPLRLRGDLYSKYDPPPIFIDGISYFDEHHELCRLGHVSKYEALLCLDPDTGMPLCEEEGGEWEDEKPTTTVKHEQEARGMFGVCITTNKNGIKVAHRLQPFFYTGKQTVIGVKKWEQQERNEMARVKSLAGRPWSYETKYRTSRERKGALKEKLNTLGFMDIRDLMLHAVTEHEKIYKGTSREKTSMIFHDGLSQWWEKEAQEYMSELGYGNRQLRILPENNEFVSIYYQDGLVGSSPELCRGLDAYGFADFKRSLTLNCVIAATLPLGDPIRITWGKGTPALLQESMRKTWEHSPPAERIIEDLMGLPDVLRTIIEAQGTVVPDLFYRKGRRAIPGSVSNLNVRPRQRIDPHRSISCHPELQAAYVAMFDIDKIKLQFDLHKNS